MLSHSGLSAVITYTVATPRVWLDRAAQDFTNLNRDCVDAGEAGRGARLVVERITEKSVVSPINYRQLQQERQRQLQSPLLPDPHEQ
jgi:hypothetical protein